MRMRLPREASSIDLPDGWWIEAGMSGFVAAGPSYLSGTTAPLLPVVSVAPIYHLFLAERRSALLERGRILRILAAFRADRAIPPILVAPFGAPLREGFRHCLVDGFHRLVASAAAGFTHIPAVQISGDLPSQLHLERVLEQSRSE